MGCDSTFLVKIYDSDHVLEELQDHQALNDIYGEYFDIHHFRHTGSTIYCLISAYKADAEEISNLLIEHLELDPEHLVIREIDIDSLFDF